MKAILIHGMGRTPASMLVLAARLKIAGIKPLFFAYSTTIENWQSCVNRLEKFINNRISHDEYIIIGHSLGTVLTRGVLKKLKNPPLACFFLAPPTIACKAAKKFAPLGLYKFLMGDMGQKLANQEFMSNLPLPNVPTKIYAGVSGFQGKHSLFDNQPNDGVLMLEETQLTNIPLETVATVHTFIMNDKTVADDIIKLTMSYQHKN